MPSDVVRRKVKALRQHLKRLDDVEIEALCLDNCPEVEEQFSEGMRRDRKINLILRYHLHHQDALELLCNELQVVGAPVPLHEVAMSCNFDLDELVLECLEILLEKRGLVGLIVPVPRQWPIFGDNFCKRLKLEWNRGQVSIKPTLVINPIHTPVEEAVRTIVRRYKPGLREGHVLFVVQVSDVDLLSVLWENLRRTIGSEDLHNCLAVVFSAGPDCTAPEGTTRLRQPRFRLVHVHRWVSQVAGTFAWSDQERLDIIGLWTDHIIVECSENDVLQVDWVYDHLEDMLRFLRQNPTPEQFRQEFERRRQIYV